MKILYATDGSPAATFAGRWIAGLPWETAPAVDVVTVVPERIPYRGRAGRGPEPDWNLLARVRAEEESASHQLLEAGAEPFRGWSPPPQMVVERGHPATEIVRLARERGADWIVIGERGVTATNLFPLGGVSLSVLRLAQCTVLLVSPDAPAPGTLLVATDLSENGDRALTAAADLPLPADARVVVLHVFEEHPLLKDLAAPVAPDVRQRLEAMRKAQEEAVRALLAEGITQFQGRGWQVTVEVREGAAADQIMAATSDHHADWIVIGARGLSSAAELPLGAVCQKIALANPSALLVVR